jgi:hypothetical protein
MIALSSVVAPGVVARFLRTPIFSSRTLLGTFTDTSHARRDEEGLMAIGIIVRLPVTVAFGTDEEFDLRVHLEREFAATLSGAEAAGRIDTDFMTVRLDGVADPDSALRTVKEVLDRNGLLDRAVVMVETPSPLDPDDRDSRVVWPGAAAGWSVA